jgi:hypothetical protein
MMKQADDEIVEEIRRLRRAHAKSLCYDQERITEDLQRQECESGTRVVQRPPRIPRDPGCPKLPGKVA